MTDTTAEQAYCDATKCVGDGEYQTESGEVVPCPFCAPDVWASRVAELISGAEQ